MPQELAKAVWSVYYFMEKPVDEEQLKYVVPNALRLSQEQNKNAILAQQSIQNREELQLEYEDIIGDSSSLLQMLGTIERCAPTNSTVLIEGESGTGKELIAKAIHANSSRDKRTMITVTCGTLPTELFESELFGHVKGAFTGAVSLKKGLFEEASGSTIFLDEIGEMPLILQVKLLRAIQEREIRPVGSNSPIGVDIRIIAATNKDLRQAVKDGKFREDLYYRLKVVPLKVPPLRDRKGDIPLLARHFALQEKKRIGVESMTCLMMHDWPGNIRELEHVIESAAVMTSEAEIQVKNLPSEIQQHRFCEHLEGATLTLELDTLNLDRIQKMVVEKALKITDNNKTRAAVLLDITPPGLYKMLDRYGLRE